MEQIQQIYIDDSGELRLCDDDSLQVESLSPLQQTAHPEALDASTLGTPTISSHKQLGVVILGAVNGN